ncbi:hypothetical protein Tco_1325178, partial [Tanacetum coccineum]
VAPPHPLSLNAPTKLDLSYSGLDEFKEPKFNGYGPRDTVLESTFDCDKESNNSKENTDDSLEKEQVSDNENSSVESVKPKNNEKLVKKTVRYFNQKVNTVRLRVVNTARPYTTPVNTVKENGVGNGYPRKGQSQSQKWTKPSTEQKEREEKSNQSQRSKSKSTKKSTLRCVSGKGIKN